MFTKTQFHNLEEGKGKGETRFLKVWASENEKSVPKLGRKSKLFVKAVYPKLGMIENR